MITEPKGSVPYIAGPYRAATPWQTMENIRRARLQALELCKMGYYPICPHANTALFDGEMPDEFWLDMAMEHMRRSDFIVTVGEWHRSSGTMAEINEAFRLDKRVYYPDHYIMERVPDGIKINQKHNRGLVPVSCRRHPAGDILQAQVQKQDRAQDSGQDSRGRKPCPARLAGTAASP